MNMQQSTVTEKRTIGRDSKGLAKLWLEDSSTRHLAQAGFTKGARYDVEYCESDGAILLTRNDDGKKKVSGRVRAGEAIAIIELKNKQTTAMAAAVNASQYAVEFFAGGIIITMEAALS